MNELHRVLVVGGGYAGVMAALRASRRLGRAGEVTLVSERPELTERIRLHEVAARGADARRPLEALLRGSRVRVEVARVDAIDVAAKTASSAERAWAYDKLIVAVGSRADLSLPGAAAHAHCLDGARVGALRAALDACADGASVVVIGGGLTGVECASELAEARPSLRVTLVTSGAVGAGLDARAAEHLRRVLARLGVAVREGARVERVEPTGVRLAGGEEVPAEVTVCATGFVASDALARWGFEVDARGRARVDAALRARGAPDVYVAGDCAAPEGAVGSPVPLGCKSAMPLGVIAAENAVASLKGRPERAVDWMEVVYCLSLGRRDGVVQAMRADGSPGDTFVTGALAAFTKELICKGTVAVIPLERDGWFEYRYRRAPGRALATAAPEVA
ncbi:MAG: FAD-dependent oxidoreductase [Polyangiales bacterium]